MFTLTPARVESTIGDLWDQDGLTPLGEFVYTEGDCWAIAWHLTQVLQGRGHRAELYSLGRRDRWVHVVVKLDDELYLDATGLYGGPALEAMWGKALFPVPPRLASKLGSYQAHLDVDFVHEPGHLEANRVALALLDSLDFLRNSAA